MLEHVHIQQQEPPPANAQIPANVREYASKHHLGMPLQAYHDSQQLRKMLVTRLVLAVCLIVLSLLCLAAYITGVILGHAGRIPLGDQQDLLWLTVTFIGITLLYIAGSWSRYRQSQQQLYICEDGLLRIDKDGDEAMRWDEVNDTSSSKHALLALYGRSWRRFAISDNLPHNVELDRDIMQTLIPYLLPRVIKRFEADQPIVFGKLLLNQSGLRSQGELIRWEEIEDVREKDGELTIKATGQVWQTHTLVEAPLVVELVKHAMRARLVRVLEAYIAQAAEYETYGDFATEQYVE